MSGVPASSYFQFSPSLHYGKEMRVQYQKPTILWVEEDQQDNGAKGRCLQRLVVFLPLLLCPHQNGETCSCFILQQNRVTQSPNIHICPNTPGPYQVSFVETISNTVSQVNLLLVEQPSLSPASKLSHVPLPPNSPVVDSCSSFKF